MIHFRQLPVTVDPQPLLQQLAANGPLWNSDDSWSNGKPLLYDTTTIVLRYNKTPEGMPPGSMWDRPAFGILDAAQKIVFDVMRAIPGEHLGKIMISKMQPGEKLDWHIDRLPPGVPLYWQRYQIPLHVQAGVRFCVEDEELHMTPGTAWWFDNQRMHAVFNDSSEDRLSMFVDIRPFQMPTPRSVILDLGR